jgi:hypothetical protein
VLFGSCMIVFTVLRSRKAVLFRRLSITCNVLQNGTQVFDSSQAMPRHLAKVFLA